MTRSLVISNRAEADLLGIWLWTHEQFGEQQADRYLDLLGAGLKACGANPKTGQNREAIRAGYWSHRIGKHVVFYKILDDAVLIQRVLHASMDFDSHLPD